MADRLNPKQVGLTTGLFAAILHAAWAILVALGVAQSLAAWLTKLHFITESHTIGAFNFVNAALLVIVTFVVGHVFGWLFASLYNWTAKKVR